MILTSHQLPQQLLLPLKKQSTQVMTASYLEYLLLCVGLSFKISVTQTLRHEKDNRNANNNIHYHCGLAYACMFLHSFIPMVTALSPGGLEDQYLINQGMAPFFFLHHWLARPSNSIRLAGY
jgi:hypothetical protein